VNIAERIPMRFAIFYLQTIKVKSGIVRRDCCGSRGDVRSLTQACSEPVHCLLAACYQLVLGETNYLPIRLSPGKDAKKLRPPSF
jgi:hypothetical protein